MTDSCLFCRIVRREIPAKLVHEDEHTLAFRDIDPKAHVASLNEAADAEMLGRLMLVAKSLAASEGLAADGYRAVVNTGPNAGQTVFHIHLHLLGGRKLGWPPG